MRSKQSYPLRISEFFGLLNRFIEERGFDIANLYEYQKVGIRKLFLGQNLFVVIRTGGGKTLIAFACLHKALSMKKIGVYLVPHSQLLYQKFEDIKHFFKGRAHVITLSGESKPTQKELQHHQNNLIIVATYEAFRAFLFQIQNRKYFPKKRVIGGVVIDEIHMIGTTDRGPKLETLIYKLQNEQASQFCFLSATFNEDSAKYWSEWFGCELIYRKTERIFKFKEEIKQRIEPISVIKEKIEITFLKCQDLIHDSISFDFRPPEVLPLKILVFCYARLTTELMAKALKKLGFGMEEENFSCEYLHAGIDREIQKEIVERFKMDTGIRIICCSPLLETGVDIPEINMIIITDSELYEAIQLSQMCGRIREEEGRVVFLVHETKREGLYNRKIEIDEDYSSRTNIRAYLTDFKLEPIKSRITHDHISWLTLEALFRHQYTLKQLANNLEIYDIDFNLKEVLENLIARKYVRRSGGRYSLTYIGATVIESGLDPDSADRILQFFENTSEPSTQNGKQRKNKTYIVQYKELLAEMAAQKLKGDPHLYGEEYDETHPKIAEMRRNIKEFLKRYNSKKPEKIVFYREIYEILPGDVETARRTAIWLASSMYTIYKGYKLHRKTLKTENIQYYQQEYQPIFQENQLMFRRMLRVIHCFQKSEEIPRKKPEVRPHPIYVKKSHYSDPILEILKRKKSQGATINEIQQQLKKFRQKTKIKNAIQTQSQENLSFSNSSIHSTLNRTLRAKISTQLEHSNDLHRPSYRYYLKEYKPRILNQKFSKRISKQTKNFLIFHDFEVVDGMVICPQCRQIGTVTIPSYQKMTICKNCWILLRKIRRGRYSGRRAVEIPESRIKEEKGFLFVNIYRRKRTIFLKTGESLSVQGSKKSKVWILKVTGRRGYAYFLDEVKNIILAGGIIASGQQILEDNHIFIKQLTPAEIKQIRKKEIIAQQLRDALECLENNVLVEKAKDFVIAKMLSNIYYTIKLGEILSKEILSRELLEDLIFKQFDYMVLAFLDLKEKTDLNEIKTSNFDAENLPNTTKYVNKLRSHEGNAEIAAWTVIKKALPPRFQFRGRQAQRFVPTALYWGARALDPFNAALNYLYDLLEEQSAKALSLAGFSQFYPGPGILHQRHTTNKIFSVETKKNRELIFDFMDAYRPPLRYYLLLAFLNKDTQLKNKIIENIKENSRITEWFQKNTITNTDFYSVLDEWHHRVFVVTSKGEQKLKRLFELIYKQNFLFKSTEKPLEDIMFEEAKLFANFLLNENTHHIPFCAFESNKTSAYVLEYFTMITKILYS